VDLTFLTKDIAITHIDINYNNIIDTLDKNNTQFEKVFYRPHLTMKIPIDLNDTDTKSLYLIKKIMINKIWPHIDDFSKKLNLSEIRYRKNIKASKLLNNTQMETHVDEDNAIYCDLYLNDNYDGGEIVFTDLNISIKPTAGLLLIYLPYHPHKVNMVYNGDRYCIGHEFLLKNNERYSYGLDFNIKKKELYGKTIK
jgi:hypothetical protein